MESSQPINTPAAPRSGVAASFDHSGRVQDEEMALGFECANPVLQIECWGFEQALQAGSD